MNHPAELALHQYMTNAASGKSSISEDTIKQVADDIAAALKRQFGGGNKRDEFRLRMSKKLLLRLMMIHPLTAHMILLLMVLLMISSQLLAGPIETSLTATKH